MKDIRYLLKRVEVLFESLFTQPTFLDGTPHDIIYYLFDRLKFCTLNYDLFDAAGRLKF